ncbi:hypothetical protein G7Y89_g10223 [Cudoniella acicularis]|uniref:C3H1-type domain-containing protein n=1 Tax=Cudoniella acicularis TaxID=354080 RepID=A0A8H4RD72_9HELO|nr:hypothetical protein G7Y89_g10223 [Cudoniella acicularis]
MASEDQDILAKISQLAGQSIDTRIARAPIIKQVAALHQESTAIQVRDALRLSKHAANRLRDYPQATTGWTSNRGIHSARGYRGGRPVATHRNRTLVLNGSSSTPTTPDPEEIQNKNLENSAMNATNSGAAWVTKKDRHLQLINTSIFEKESQNRAKAIEETRKQKLAQRDLREKTKFTRHLQRVAGTAFTPSSLQKHPGSSIGNYEINVQGIQFRVAKSGSKLVKVPGERASSPKACIRGELSTLELGLLCVGDLNAAKSTPKTAIVGGVKFHRSKNGNMYRAGIIKAHRRNAVVKKINEPCKMFTLTGSCSKGPKCRYIHDPSKVAVCKEFLSKGSCPSGESCDLSHDLTPERTPTCLHFAKGNCSNPNCRYTHVRVSPNALVCRSFGIYGYCEKGASCEERHVHECPDFSNTGTCTTKGCKLPHRYKASVMRSSTNRGEVSADDESSDISSDDEDEEIDSDDVDSDDLDEEFFGDDDGTPDVDAMQQDYVQLS